MRRGCAAGALATTAVGAQAALPRAEDLNRILTSQGGEQAMRQGGLWHSSLVELIVSMRHHDTIVIADAGLPVPANVPTIELGWQRREPRLLPVLRAVLGELVVEQATIAAEAADAELLEGLQAQLRGLPIVRTTHEAIKAGCASARAVVRTGEDTPFANVILHAGVPFPAAPAGPAPNGHEVTRGRVAP